MKNDYEVLEEIFNETQEIVLRLEVDYEYFKDALENTKEEKYRHEFLREFKATRDALKWKRILLRAVVKVMLRKENKKKTKYEN